MAKMIQIRNVPDELHRKLKARAAEAGFSLSDYLLRDIARTAEMPTEDELFERARKRRARLGIPVDTTVEALREED